MLIGDDVVDLLDGETSLDHLHPRFLERVFTPDERRRISTGADPKASLWACWAAKESAYKVLRKADPERVFSPRSLEIELWSPPGCDLVRGAVADGNRRLDLRIVHGGEWVHAVVTQGADVSGAGGILSAVERCPPGEDPSRAVRLAAARAIADRLGWDAADLRIDRSRPPRAVGVAEAKDLNLSLSHHGRWVSFAAALPGAARRGNRSGRGIDRDGRTSAAVGSLEGSVFPR